MAPIGLLLTTAARFLADERGSTAIEYGLIAALLGVALMTTIFSMGSGLKTTLYGGIVNAMAAR